MIHRFLSLLVLLVLSASVTQAQPEAALQLADDNGYFTTIENARIYYIAEGNPQHPAVILIHGFGGSTVTWQQTLPALAEAGFYAIALDLPPFGLSDKSADLTYTRAQMADWTAGLMDELGIEEAAIVGHSMGGAVTAQFALRHPERTQALVFVAGAVPASRQAMQATPEPDSDDDESPLNLLNDIDPNSPFAAAALRLLFTENRFADMLSSAYAEDYTVSDETLQAYMRPLQLDDWPQGFLAYLGTENSNPVTANDLAEQIEKPVLILWGAADTWVPPAVGQALHDALRGSQLITYADVGHLPMEEVPESFNADLIDFLQEIEAQ